MNSEEQLKELEDRLLKLNVERESLGREIQNLKAEISGEIKSEKIIFGRALV